MKLTERPEIPKEDEELRGGEGEEVVVREGPAVDDGAGAAGFGIGLCEERGHGDAEGGEGDEAEDAGCPCEV